MNSSQLPITQQSILLNANIDSKEEAVEIVGDLLIVDHDVEGDYLKMLTESANSVQTHVENEVVIIGGDKAFSSLVHSDGLALAQINGGVDWNGNVVKLVFAFSSKEGPDAGFVSKLKKVCSDPMTVEQITRAHTEQEIISLLNS